MIRAALTTERPIRITSMMTGVTCSYARNTSMPVKISSRIQTVVKLLIVPCSASSTCVASWALMRVSPLRHLDGHQIHQREHEHPHQVDKVPVQPGHFDVFILELAAADRDRDDGQVNH